MKKLKTERKLTREEYLKLKGLRAMHDDLQRQQKNIWSAVETILSGVVSDEELDSYTGDFKEYAVDSMHQMGGLDSWLEDKGIEVEEDE